MYSYAHSNKESAISCPLQQASPCKQVGNWHDWPRELRPEHSHAVCMREGDVCWFFTITFRSTTCSLSMFTHWGEQSFMSNDVQTNMRRTGFNTFMWWWLFRSRGSYSCNGYLIKPLILVFSYVICYKQHTLPSHVLRLDEAYDSFLHGLTNHVTQQNPIRNSWTQRSA